MEKFTQYARSYLRRMDLQDVAALKFCLLSAGVLAGLTLPEKYKKPAGALAGLLFAGTYIPLMADFLGAAFAREAEAEAVQFAEAAEPACAAAAQTGEPAGAERSAGEAESAAEETKIAEVAAEKEAAGVECAAQIGAAGE